MIEIRNIGRRITIIQPIRLLHDSFFLTLQVMIHNVHTVSVNYHEFENCTHSEAILYLLRHSLNNTISLSELMNIRIDGFRRPSYTARISDLRRK